MGYVLHSSSSSSYLSPPPPLSFAISKTRETISFDAKMRLAFWGLLLLIRQLTPPSPSLPQSGKKKCHAASSLWIAVECLGKKA